MPCCFSTGVIPPLAEPPDVLGQAQLIFAVSPPHCAFEIGKRAGVLWFPESLSCTGEGKQGGCGEHYQAGSSIGLDPLML